MIPFLQIPVGAARVSILAVGTGRWKALEQLRVPATGWTEDAAPLIGQLSPIPFQCVLIELASAAILVDAMDFREYRLAHGGSVPADYAVPRLDQQLAQMGIAATQVTTVVVTHAHDDHYQLVTVEEAGQRVALFPAAIVIAHQADWTPAGQQAILQSQPEAERNAEAPERYMGAIIRRGQLRLITEDTEIAPGIQLLHTPGESPGHVVVRVQSQEQTLYCLGDLVHHPLEVSHPGWVPLWAEPQQTLRSRETIFAAALAEDALLVAAHIAGVGRLAPTQTGVAWETVEVP